MEEGKDIEYIQGYLKISCEVNNFCKTDFIFLKKKYI